MLEGLHLGVLYNFGGGGGAGMDKRAHAQQGGSRKEAYMGQRAL